MSAPDPALVARMQRLARGQRESQRPSDRRLVLHGYRYMNPKLGDGLDLGDIVEGLQHAMRAAKRRETASRKPCA